jgi:hypothetical protein
MLARFAHMFDRSMRVYLCKALLFPIINLYDIIYGVASAKCLARLNSAYNSLMRTVAGIHRSQHVRITDLYSMTTFDSLTKRRQTSLYNFMSNVRTGNQYSVLRNSFVKLSHNYATRAFDNYAVPSSRREVGQKRVCVRGLKLLNDVSNDVVM